MTSTQNLHIKIFNTKICARRWSAVLPPPSPAWHGHQATYFFFGVCVGGNLCMKTGKVIIQGLIIIETGCPQKKYIEVEIIILLTT